MAKGQILSFDLETKGPVEGSDSDGRIVWGLKEITAIISLAGLNAGAQIPLYFVGGSLSFIAADIGGASKISWLPVAYSLAIASFAPFCGYPQDLFGRRYIMLYGGVTILSGIIIVATAHSPGQAVAGMSIAGAGAGIGELTALAGISELVPVNKRGMYIGVTALFLVPFTPYVMYSQLLFAYHTWRWGLWICFIYNGISVSLAFLTYHPSSRARAAGVTRKDILKKVDYFGGFLSIVGLALFLVALQSGGYTKSWKSVYVLCTLLIGLGMIAAFVVWEWKGAEYPIVPRELFAGQRITAVAFLISFVAGMNLYSLLNFLPLEFSSVFPQEPVQVGLKGLGPALSIVIGVVLVNTALSCLKSYNRELILISTIIMTAFGGALAVATPDTPRTLVALGVISGFGVGGVIIPSQTMAITVCPDELIATCVSLSLAIRVVGGSVGYTIYYNVFYHKLMGNLPSFVADYAIKAGLPSTSVKEFVDIYLARPDQVATVPGVTPMIIAAATVGSRWAYAESFKYVWYTSVAFGICAIIACLFMGNTRKYMTNRIAATITH